MDREHPIPQEVSTYEFRLVGDMTIKQFMQVAAGALIALVLYSSNMAPYVKWPLIIISFISGVALAFFPIEDRPLSKWIVLFVKAIYSPTVYVWNKNARKYEFFQPENANITLPPIPDVPAMPQPAGTLNKADTLSSSGAAPEDTKLDKEEAVLLDKVNEQFASPTQSVIPTEDIKNLPPLTQNAAAVEMKKMEIPASNTVKIEPQEKPKTEIKPPEFNNQSQIGGQITPIATTDLPQAKTATFSEDASPPSPPSSPNVIVGQILDPEGKIIDGAILEIKDSEGRSVRALRSNRLGHFMIVTPLVDGKYQITTEKEGFTFDPVSFEAKDQIIPPIAIWAKT